MALSVLVQFGFVEGSKMSTTLGLVSVAAAADKAAAKLALVLVSKAVSEAPQGAADDLRQRDRPVQGEMSNGASKRRPFIQYTYRLLPVNLKRSMLSSEITTHKQDIANHLLKDVVSRSTFAAVNVIGEHVARRTHCPKLMNVR